MAPIFSEYPHKFNGKLKGKSVVEHQEAFFEIEVEADDADVSWYQVRKKAILVIFPRYFQLFEVQKQDFIIKIHMSGEKNHR